MRINPESWDGYTGDTREDDWQNKLNLFEQLIVIKSFKEEKVTFAMAEFVQANLGKEFIESPSVDLSILFEDMSATIPLVFVLSTGSDPMNAFMRFAKEMGYTSRYLWIRLFVNFEEERSQKCIDLKKSCFISSKNVHINVWS